MGTYYCERILFQLGRVSVDTPRYLCHVCKRLVLNQMLDNISRRYGQTTAAFKLVRPGTLFVEHNARAVNPCWAHRRLAESIVHPSLYTRVSVRMQVDGRRTECWSKEKSVRFSRSARTLRLVAAVTDDTDENTSSTRRLILVSILYW